MAMPDSEAKKKWDKENMVFVAFKLFRANEKKRNDQDIIDFFEGKVKGEIIKAALREYIANHPQEYAYGMKYRGYSPGCQPSGVKERRDDPTGKYHDIIVYDRKLSADEVRDYELEELKGDNE